MSDDDEDGRQTSKPKRQKTEDKGPDETLIQGSGSQSDEIDAEIVDFNPGDEVEIPDEPSSQNHIRRTTIEIETKQVVES